MEQLKELFRKGLFRGRYKGLKYTAAMVFMVAACVATLGTLAFASMVSTEQYQVKDLEVKQDGTGLEVNWEDTEADGYTVFLQCNGERPKIYQTEVPHCRIELDVLDQEYRVTVTAVNRIGGLSAAKSDNVATKKLAQTVETEKEKYVGLEDKKGPLEAEAHGDITYTSSNPAVVEVSDKGVMSYKRDGRAEVTIQVAEEIKTF